MRALVKDVTSGINDLTVLVKNVSPFDVSVFFGDSTTVVSVLTSFI